MEPQPDRLDAVIGRAVARRRRALGLRQVDLAERTGLSRPAIAAIETDRRLVGLDELVSLCQALDVGLAGLLGSDPRAAVLLRWTMTTPTPRVTYSTGVDFVWPKDMTVIQVKPQGHGDPAQ